jgi:hypothetical protein
MRILLFQHRIILFAVFVAAASAPIVRAECGDYVRLKSGTTVLTGTAHADSLPKPCHGPNCSKNTPAPKNAPVTTVSQRVDDWAMQVTTDVIEEQRVCLQTFFEFETEIDPLRTSIFHPPR